ncbi:MAG: phage tail protein [Dehalococcoidia bacterium]
MAVDRVFTAFNFLVEISVDGISDQVCEAGFAECDGLEMSIEPKSFQQGGLNTEQIHLSGSTSYSQLTLRRGMSKDFGLWRWFTETMKTDKRGLRGQATVVMLDANKQEQMKFKLKDCLPVKLRAPALNAREGGIAVEELSLVYAAMELEFPG